MTTLQHTIRQARRRQTINRMIHAAGLGTTFGVGVCILLLLVDRIAFGGLELSWVFFATLVAIGLVSGAAWPLLKVPDLAEMALQLDRALRLKDRIATAHAMTLTPSIAATRTGPRYDNSFSELVRRDAERMAGNVDVRSVVPVRITGVWGAAVIATIVFAGCFLLLPSMSWGEEPPLSPQQRQLVAEQEQELLDQERAELQLAIEEAVDEARAEAAVDDRAREQLEALERLSQQLQTEGATEEDVERLRDESAAVLNELSRRLAEQSRRDALAAEKAAERFSNLQTPQTPMTAEQFTEALRRGDFGRAADSLDELLNRQDELSPEQRRELAEHLQDLSHQLDQAGQAEQQELAERAAQLEQALRDQGLDQETIEQLLAEMPRSEEELTREMLDQQLDEDVARRLARELQRLQEQREIEQQTQQDAQAVNEALREAAEQFDDEVAQEATEPPSTDAESATADDSDPADAADSTQGAEEATAEDFDQPQQNQSGQDEPSQDSPQQQADSPQQQGEEQPPQQSQQEREAAEQQRGAQQDDSREQSGEQGAEQASESGEAEAEQSPQSGEQGEPGEQPGGEGESDPSAADEGDNARGESGEQEQPGGSASDALREMEKRREAAGQRRQSSERLRQRAQEMVSDAAGAQDQTNTTGDAASEAAGTTSVQRPTDATESDPLEAEIEDIDLRDEDGEPGELIAEWMDESSPREGAPQSRRSDAEQRVRQAQEVAERAVNEASVPSRYHRTIRRYFNRLNETVERATNGAGQDNP